MLMEYPSWFDKHSLRKNNKYIYCSCNTYLFRFERIITLGGGTKRSSLQRRRT
jgi:hypothetical protein